MTSRYEELFNAMKAGEQPAKTPAKTTAPAQEKSPSKQSMQEAADEAMRRKEEAAPTTKTEMGKKKGGCVKMAKGGYVRAADGCAQRGKTRGKLV